MGLMENVRKRIMPTTEEKMRMYEREKEKLEKERAYEEEKTKLAKVRYERSHLGEKSQRPRVRWVKAKRVKPHKRVQYVQVQEESERNTYDDIFGFGGGGSNNAMDSIFGSSTSGRKRKGNAWDSLI